MMVNENYLAMTEGVKKFLDGTGCGQYYDMFLAKGFDSENDICHLNREDLDSMYITEQTDRQQILAAAAHYQPSQEFALYTWLREKGLDHYFINFLQSDLVDFDSIGRLNLPDEDMYDELEITLPGHKRRLERAVRQLSKKARLHEDVDIPMEPMGVTSPAAITCGHVDAVEMPLAYGRWGKPRCLLEAKYDFLVLDAILSSTTDPRNRVKMEFMVDSGSDVVTIREEVLDSLNLELIGPIKSKGVHASRTKNLYKANIHIGNQLLEIEVMGETYDSIGSRVIRHFRHYVNGSRHIWLKGDYVDHSMSPRTLTPSQESHMTSSGSTSASSEEKTSGSSVLSSQETRTTVSSQGSDRQSEEAVERSHDPAADDISELTGSAPLSEEVHMADLIERTAAEMEEGMGGEAEAASVPSGERVVEVIPVPAADNGDEPGGLDQVDGFECEPMLMYSTTGRPRQRFLLKGTSKPSGINIYEGTSFPPHSPPQTEGNDRPRGVKRKADSGDLR